MKKTDEKSIREKIHMSITDFYEENGYILKKVTSTFVNNGFFIEWGPTSKYYSSLVFRPWFRIETVEIKEILKNLFPNEFSFNTIIRTQSSEFANEMGIKDFDYSLFNYRDENGTSYYYDICIETDLQPIIDDHINFMEKVGFPFFEKMSTLEGIDDYINGRVLDGDKEYFQSEERQKEVKKFFDKREVLSGIIAAQLIKNPRLNELIERYKIMFERNNYILDDVNKVLEYF